MQPFLQAFFVFQRIQDHPVQAESQPHPTRLIPDSIKINRDALSFVLKIGKDLPSLLHFKIRKEKQQWQSQTHLLELTYKGDIEEPEGAAEILEDLTIGLIWKHRGSLSNKN